MNHPQILVVFAGIALSACSDAQPAVPSAASPSLASTAAVEPASTSRPQDHKGPDHFDPGPLRGFDAVKWHDLTYRSPKYDFGRALVLLPVSEESLQQVAAAQGLTYLGNGRVQFKDGTIVDAILGRNSSNPRWQYLVAS